MPTPFSKQRQQDADEGEGQFEAQPNSEGGVSYVPAFGSIAARDIELGENPAQLHNRLLSKGQLENERLTLEQHRQLVNETESMQKAALDRQKYIDEHTANLASGAMIHELGQLGQNPTHKQVNDVVDKYSEGLRVKGTDEYVKNLRDRIDKDRADQADRNAASINDPEIRDVYNKSFALNGDHKIANNDAKAASALKDRARKIANDQYTTDADRASLIDPATGKINWQNADKIQTLEDKAGRVKNQAEGGQKHLKDLTTNFTNLSAALGEQFPAELKKNFQDNISQLTQHLSGQIPGTQAAEQGGAVQPKPEDELGKLLGRPVATPTPSAATPTPAPITATPIQPVPETTPTEDEDKEQPEAAAKPVASLPGGDELQPAAA
jgi:hypothetical protein